MRPRPAPSAFGKDVLVLFDRQNECPARTGVVGAERDRNDDDQVAQRRPEHRQQGKGENDGRERLERVGQEDDDVVDEPAEVAAEHAEDESDAKGDGYRRHGHLELDPRPEDEAGEDVPPQLVGSEQVMERRSLQGGSRRWR